MTILGHQEKRSAPAPQHGELDREHAVMYYGPRLGIDNWTVGRCDREDVDEIEALQGHPRVWFFFTQSGNGKAQRMRELFEARGVEEVAIDDRFGLTGESETAAYRYHLGDP
jgi:hypothetical protein